MALSVARARVKERCGVSDASLDAAIDNLIADVVPVLEHAIREQFLLDPSTGLQATLNLGALEVVCGELMAMRLRAPGAYESVVSGELESRPLWTDPSDPGGLKAQGLARLRPFLRPDVAGGLSVMGSGGTKNPPAIA